MDRIGESERGEKGSKEGRRGRGMSVVVQVMNDLDEYNVRVCKFMEVRLVWLSASVRKKCASYNASANANVN
jgi:hypothetical protein